MCSLRFKNNLLTIEGVRFASISKETPLSKLSFAFVSLALPLLVQGVLLGYPIHTISYTIPPLPTAPPQKKKFPDGQFCKE
jgi:hypothetical protein